MIDVRAAALEAHEAGLCVVPLREDGSRRPDGKWEPCQTRRPSAAPVENWHCDGRTDLGFVCVAGSGGLEMLEFEGRAVAEGIDDRDRELAQAAGLGDVLSGIQAGSVERTPSGCFHIPKELNYPVARRVVELPVGRQVRAT
jgi:hypothetical protein